LHGFGQVGNGLLDRIEPRVASRLSRRLSRLVLGDQRRVRRQRQAGG
jgi:hypothetical protein